MRSVFALLFVLPLAACTSLSFSSVPRPEVERPATVDPGAAAAMVSAFRQGRGLPPVVLDDKLMAIAARHSRAMAGADKLAHVLPGEGSIRQRLIDGGFDAAVAVENIGAGYHNLGEAFSGWRASPAHRDNMLKQRATRMGIAVAHSPTSKFGDFWTLVLAAPAEKLAGGPR